jgi:phage-related baseplate assembly protein
MPSEYGSLSKIYVEKQNVENLNIGEIPSTLDFCVLAYNQNKQLVTASDALKNNLSTYLSQYRMIGDSLRIKDAFIINIAVEFEIITLPNYNSNTTLLKCITALQNYFNIDNWQINQPILLRDIYVLLDRIEGVQTVKVVNIINKAGESLGYSQYAYDISGATLNNIVYPSLDTSIFEVKYPNTDISGKVVNF